MRNYVAIIGNIDHPVHVWRQVDTWNQACDWLAEAFASLEQHIGAQLLDMAGGHIYAKSSFETFTDDIGLPIYSAEAGSTVIIGATPAYDNHDAVCIVEPTRGIAVVGHPVTGVHVWDRTTGFVPACFRLKELGQAAATLANSADVLTEGHVLSEAMAAQVKTATGGPMYPKPAIDRYMTVIMN